LLCLLIFFLSLNGCDQQDQGREGSFHTLGNGMGVILVENHANPMVSSVICVKAGSAYEDRTNNGVSHLLEHLLFDGTGERTRIEIMEGIEDHGGYLNATTRDDHTAYILLIPSEHGEFGLNIQKDMLFNSIFPDSELVKERKVVIEEINKDSDSPNYVSEKFHRSYLYHGTPFSKPVIGFKNIIASISKEEIISYYRERYVPENMVAFITGDFKSEEMLADLERIFGVVPPGNDPETIDQVRLPRRSNKIYRLNNQYEVSNVNISFDAPAPGEDDYYPYDYFVRTLNYHEGAPLLATLKGGSAPLAFSVSTDLSPHPGFSTFTINISTKPGKEETVVQTVLDLLKKESSEEPGSDEIQGVMVDIKSGEYFLKERYHYYGLMKAPFIVSAGFDFLENYVSRMEEVSPSMIRKVAEQHFSRPRYVATVVGPPGPPGHAVSESVPLKEKGTITKEVLANGMRLIVREEAGSDIFAVHVLAGNRVYMESDGKHGLSDFLSRMLMRGTETRDSETLAGDLAGIGASVTVVDNPYIPYDDYYTSRQYSFIRFETLGEYWREGLDLLSDIIRNPALDSKEIEGTRQKMLSLIYQRDASTYKTARRLFYETLFRNHSFAHSIMGMEDDIEAISGADLKWLHKTLYAPNNLVISVVSGVSTDSVVKSLSTLFSDMEPMELPGEVLEVPRKLSVLRVAEERMGKEQAYIYMGNIVPGIEDDDVPTLRMMIAILSERLALELREKEGLAYSVGASAEFARGFGWYAITMGTEQSNYNRALSGIRREIERFRSEGVEEEVLEKAINRVMGRSLMRRLSSINRASYSGIYEFLLDDYGQSEIRLNALKEVRTDDIRRLARKYLHSNEGVLVAVR
jgi:zinc protease